MNNIIGVETDWKKYLGRWWEQARVPSWFENQFASDVTADYTLMPDGSIRIVNAATDLLLGTRTSVVGRARVDLSRSGTLRVSFFPPFESDYIVLGHGCADPNAYDCAVVGTQDRKHLWFLTRTPHCTNAQLAMMKQIAIQKGYGPTLFHLQQTPKTKNQ